MRLNALLLIATLASAASAQHPLRHTMDGRDLRFARSQPIVSYLLRVDSADLSGWSVEMRIRNAPDSFRVAMARHPEYHDRWFRYVQGLSITAPDGPATIAGVDSGPWIVRAPGGESVISYRIRLPAPEEGQRAAWRPFLTPTGGLTGGPHTFMYVLGAELAPSHVEVKLPASWNVATALPRTNDPAVFFAPSVDVLMESPLFVGRFHDWSYRVDGVPHRVVYWSLPNGSAFDTATFVGALEKFSRQAVALFGRAPYRDYTFVFQDGAYGGLEHPGMVTLGTPSATLAQNPLAEMREAAHEYFHTWNLMRIRPAEYAGVDYRAPAASAGLWFSEGLTIYYGDALLRRAKLPGDGATRLVHLTNLIARYLDNPGASKLSAELVSRVAYNAAPGATGDYSVSTHMQGELIGTLLDFVIRDATGGTRSMDDVMRLMLERFSGERGFTGRDVERAVSDVCRCNVTPFFDAHVRSGTPIDIARYVRLAGLEMDVKREPVVRDGQPEPDLRLYGWNTDGSSDFRLRLMHPDNVWGRAGLHTGDKLVSLNGGTVANWPELRTFLRSLRTDDTVRVAVARASGPFTTLVRVSGYDHHQVTLRLAERASAKQVAIRERWMTGW
jgi:predicted metalloprotease with PDZ domain